MTDTSCKHIGAKQRICGVIILAAAEIGPVVTSSVLKYGCSSRKKLVFSVCKSSPVQFFGLKIGNRQPQPARTGLDQVQLKTSENGRKRVKMVENGSFYDL